VAERLQGLDILVHPPEIAPVRDFHWFDPSSALEHHISTSRWVDVAHSGQVEIVAHLGGLADRLMSVNVGRARALSLLASFWQRRQQDLAKSVAKVRRLSCHSNLKPVAEAAPVSLL
jgi:hypothetical protein